MTRAYTSLYGPTAPIDLWAIFNGVSKMLQLSPEQQQAILKTPPQASSAPPPAPETADRIEALKDCAIMAGYVLGGDITLVRRWMHSPVTSFNQLSPLQLMEQAPAAILASPETDHPALQKLRQQADSTQSLLGLTMVLENLRFADGGIIRTGTSASAKEINMLTTALIRTGRRYAP